jgi:hypothetical protein
MQTEINIRIGNKAPREYLTKLQSDINKKGKVSGIQTEEQLKVNLVMNCIPASISGFDVSAFDEFLAERRTLMARKIRSIIGLCKWMMRTIPITAGCSATSPPTFGARRSAKMKKGNEPSPPQSLQKKDITMGTSRRAEYCALA